MSLYSKLYIKPGKERSIERGHPWVFSGAVLRSEGSLEEGNVVEVLSNKDRHLGFGHYQNGSITVRLLSVDGTEPDDQFYVDRIQSAWRLRISLGLTNDASTTIFRLIHGEGDFLPGLIIDHYAGHLIIQCHSIGMYCDINRIQNALVQVMGSRLKSIYLKCSGTLPKEYGGYEGDRYIYNTSDVPIEACEHNNRFHIDWIHGQKTGFFIDQRENRLLLGRYAEGQKVLNTFCYSGGFSVYALNKGARLVHSLDASQKAIDLTDQNILLGGFEHNRHQSFVGDTMDFIKDLKEDYDIIILDPPAFAKHRNAKHNAVQGYKRLNAHAIRQIKPGGIIFTFSCSQVIDKELFTNTIIAAAIEAKRKVRILEQLHQPADHPINSAHPEGEYLKGLVIEVE
jgi:23S rRNA (cytosine1962-C5)-methyltransferase